VKKSDDGGPAYPLCTSEWRDVIAGGVIGMSLRDYFVAAALQGMLARPSFYMDYAKFTKASEEESAAYYAFELADAMLVERAKRDE